MSARKLELLSPAKNVEIGIAAITAGAHAVYIAGPSYGARSWLQAILLKRLLLYALLLIALALTYT